MISEFVCLGKVVRAHGIKGALSVKLDNPTSNALRGGLSIQLRSLRGGIQNYKVASFTAGRILQVVGVDDRNEAEKLSQSLIYVEKASLPKIQDDEIYLLDMLGYQVVDDSGNVLGTVESFSDNTAQILLGVRSEAGMFALIPYVSPLIRQVSEDSKKIIVDLPDGLFENEKDKS